MSSFSISGLCTQKAQLQTLLTCSVTPDSINHSVCSAHPSKKRRKKGVGVNWGSVGWQEMHHGMHTCSDVPCASPAPLTPRPSASLSFTSRHRPLPPPPPFLYTHLLFFYPPPPSTRPHTHTHMLPPSPSARGPISCSQSTWYVDMCLRKVLKVLISFLRENSWDPFSVWDNG